MSESSKEFMAKITKIQHGLKAPKSQKNSFGNYNYRSCEDIKEAIKPLLLEYELVLTTSCEIVEIAGRFYVKATARLSDHENMITANGFAREAENKKGMDDSQITGSTQSYSVKYALNNLLCIDDTKDADSMDNREKVDSRGNSGQIKPIQKEKPTVKDTHWLDKCVDLGKEQFSAPENFKKWRAENGFVDNLKEANDFELMKLHTKLKEFADLGVE